MTYPKGMLGNRYIRAGLLLAALGAAAACGRIGFDPLGLSAAERDASVSEEDASFAELDGALAQPDAAPLTLTDPPSLAGVWSIMTLTVPVEGVPTVVPRATDGTGVLGEFELTSTGALSFVFKASTLYINAQEYVEFNVLDGTMEIQPDGVWLIVATTGEVVPLSAELNGDELSLVWLKLDPRNSGSLSVPDSTVIKRNPAYAAATSGSWEALEVEYRDGNVFTPTNCVMLGAGDYQRITMDTVLDSILRLEVTFRNRHYSDAACQNIVSDDTESWIGMGLETNSVLEFWAIEMASSETVFFDGIFSLEGANMRLNQTSCLPLPACLDISEKHLFAPAGGG